MYLLLIIIIIFCNTELYFKHNSLVGTKYEFYEILFHANCFFMLYL